jgi:hypothetical protein
MLKRVHSSSMKLKILAVAFLLLAMFKSASAVVVTVNSVQYDITTITTSFTAGSLELMAQPWWSDSQTSVDFASAVGGSLGTPNFGGLSGPYFAYDVPFNREFAAGYFAPVVGHTTALGDATDQEWTYAVASQVPDSGSALYLSLITLPALLFVERRFRS